jgi:hypothetical protein
MGGGMRTAFVIGLVFVNFSANAESSSAAMTAFGLIGAWSKDCSVSVTQACMDLQKCVDRVEFKSSMFGNLTQENIMQPVLKPGPPSISTTQFNSAARIAEDKIKLTYTIPPSSINVVGSAAYVIPLPGEVWETVFRREGNKLRGWDWRRADGQKIRMQNGLSVLPADGWNKTGPVSSWKETGNESVALEKCSNEEH